MAPARPRWPPWGPLYLAILLAATLSPLRFSCSAKGLQWEPAAVDVIPNLLLFVPLGWLFSRRAWWQALLTGFALSLGIEFAQQWLFRSPSPWDLLANTGGAALGALLPRFKVRVPQLDLRWPGLILGLGLLEAVAWLASTTPPADLSNWTPMPLVVGCEERVKPNFAGTIHGLAIYDRAITPSEELGLARAGGWEDGGPIFALDFTRHEGWTDGPAARREVLLSPPPGMRMEQDGLHLENPGWYLPEAPAEHARQRLMQTGAISILAEITMPTTAPTGRARVFAMTEWHSTWDFMLAHGNRGLLLWLRTPAMADAYEDSLGEPGNLPVALGARGTAVFTVDGERVRGYWNGECRAERLLTALGRPFLVGRGMGFTLAVVAAWWGLVGALWGARLGWAWWIGLGVGATVALAYLVSRGALEPLGPGAPFVMVLGIFAAVAAGPVARYLTRPTSTV